MAVKSVEHEVGPIVREKADPTAIRNALDKGCGGVIIEGSVPPTVTAELERLSVIFDDGYNEHYVSGANQRYLQQSRILKCRTSEKGMWNWQNTSGYLGYTSDYIDDLSETCRWLKDEMVWALQAGLVLNASGPFNDAALKGRDLRMDLWLMGGINVPWHVDYNPASRRAFVHTHIYGDGLVVASPPQAQSVQIIEKQKQASRWLLEEFSTLEDRGFETVKLQPGERIVFGNRCLHKSSEMEESATQKLKVRAATF